MDDEPIMMISKSQFDKLISRNEKTLRDEIAIGALQGLISSHANPNCSTWPSSENDINLIVELSYSYADAMMKEREKWI